LIGNDRPDLRSSANRLAQRSPVAAFHGGVFERPLQFDEARAVVSSWLAQPNVGIAEPGDRHWEILQDLSGRGQANGALVMDAVLAAISIEYGATLCTTDRDFSRFPGLKYVNPISARN
jgi:predicted nucleic acid-binding protein